MRPIHRWLSLVYAGSAWACGATERQYPPSSQHAPLFAEDFSSSALGAKWRDSAALDPSSNKIAPPLIQNGRLVLKERENHPIWCTIPLPRRFVLDMDIWPLTAQGDVKIEIAGDGQSKGGRGAYRASGYVLVFGGWNGTRHMIARQDEHGDQVRSRPAGGIDKGRRYHVRIERRDASIRWFVDGRLLLQMRDDAPLYGPNARYLGLSAYRAPVAFDAIRLFPLPRP